MNRIGVGAREARLERAGEASRLGAARLPRSSYSASSVECDRFYSALPFACALGRRKGAGAASGVTVGTDDDFRE